MDEKPMREACPCVMVSCLCLGSYEYQSPLSIGVKLSPKSLKKAFSISYRVQDFGFASFFKLKHN